MGTGTGASGGDPGKPATGKPDLIITGKLEGGTTTSAVEGATHSVALNVSAKPSFSPAIPSEIPSTHKATSVTIDTPKSACIAKVYVALTAEWIGINVSGKDTSPATDCDELANAIRETGIELTLAGVPWANGSTAIVKVTLTP